MKGWKNKEKTKRTNSMKKTKLPYYEIFSLLLGEIIISLLICAVYLIIDRFDYKVVTGVSLGTLVTMFNFLFLSVIILFCFLVSPLLSFKIISTINGC